MGNEIIHQGDVLLYSDENGKEFVNVVFMEETFWLTQIGMAELFDSSKSNISEHLSNIFEEEELDKASCMRKFGISEFSTKPTNFYNLDAIIAVGYRVNSKKVCAVYDEFRKKQDAAYISDFDREMAKYLKGR